MRSLPTDEPDSLAAESAVDFRVACTVSKAMGELRLRQDGTLEFRALEDQGGFIACCGDSPSQFVIRAEELVGVRSLGAAALEVWYCVKKAGPRRRKLSSLAKSPVLHCQSAADVDALRSRVMRLVRPGAEAARPRRVHVIVNPVGGVGRGKQVFLELVQPMLEVAGLELAVDYTTGAGHATSITQHLQVDDLYCIAAVGGDGTMYETLQGLFRRDDWERARQVPLAHIPTGSGNGMSASMGLWDATTAAFAIVKGCTQPMDVATCWQPASGKREFSFLMVTSGLLANLDIGTEHLRWMGEARFTYGALREVLQSKKYRCGIAYVSASQADAVRKRGEAEGMPSEWAHPPSSLPAGPATPLLSTLGGHLSSLDPQQQSTLPEGWQSMGRDAFEMLVIENLNSLALNTQLNPGADHSDGAWELIWTRGVSKTQGLAVLLSSDDGSFLQKPYVHLERVSAAVIDPLDAETWLCVDGEVVPYERLFLEVHQALCTTLVSPYPL